MLVGDDGISGDDKMMWCVGVISDDEQEKMRAILTSWKLLMPASRLGRSSPFLSKIFDKAFKNPNDLLEFFPNNF